MSRTGILSIINGESQLNGLLLARENRPNPLGAATTFLQASGFQSGDGVTVAGHDGMIGGVAVMFITAAQPAVSAMAMATVNARKARKKKPAGKKTTAGPKSPAVKKTPAAKKKRVARKKPDGGRGSQR